MGRAPVFKGQSIQGDSPEWGPLFQTVGEEIVGDFMWMFEVELADGGRVQAYKHIDTRGYLHLDADGGAWLYESPQRYRSVPVADLLVDVIAGLPGLAGVTDEQIRASWRAVDRLEAKVYHIGGTVASDGRDEPPDSGDRG